MLITAQSGHTMKLVKIKDTDVFDTSDYDGPIYEVRNYDPEGVIFMYVVKGYSKNDGTGKEQVHAWYPNGEMWSSYALTYKDAIDGAQRDGWLATRRSGKLELVVPYLKDMIERGDDEAKALLQMIGEE